MSQSKTSAFFQNETLTHFFESALLSEGLGNDMTPCFYNSDQIFIKVTFSIENRSQRMFNLCVAIDEIVSLTERIHEFTVKLQKTYEV